MAIYNQIATLAIIFQIGNDLIKDIDKIILNKNLIFRRILIVSGNSVSKQIAEKVNLEIIIGRVVVIDNTFAEVNRISKIVTEENIDLVIGVGGGKVLDVVKRVSLLQKLNHISIPTIISNDGLISPISVLKNQEQRTESIAGLMPIGVIIDLDIILNSPTAYIQSAAGDILSNMSATNDWLFAANNKYEKINDISFQLSRMSAHSSINFNEIDLQSKDFVKMLIQGQLNSGIAMGLSGNSRPCSGSEHLISHAIDFLNISNNKLHGFQVGLISQFCLYLQNDLSEKIVRYARLIAIDNQISTTCIDFRDNFFEIMKLSRKMRPGRITILDHYKDQELFDLYKKYIDFSDQIN